MPYLGSVPAVTALTSANIADGAVNSDEIATGAVDLAHLSASGTKNSTTYLRGDNAFATVAGGVALGATPASVQVFTSSGTWTRPTGILTIVVTVVGSGAGGAGGSEGGGTTDAGGGGGGGGTAIELIDVTSLSSETVTIGAGGAGGAANNVGAAGATSSFGSYCTATGGTGGAVASLGVYSGSGGGGGVGSGGNVNAHGGGAPQRREAHIAVLDGYTSGGGTMLSQAAGINTNHVYGCGGSGQNGSGGSGSSDNDGAPGVCVVWEYK